MEKNALVGSVAFRAGHVPQMFAVSAGLKFSFSSHESSGDTCSNFYYFERKVAQLFKKTLKTEVMFPVVERLSLVTFHLKMTETLYARRVS